MRDRQNPALFGRLDHVRPEAVYADRRHLGVLRDDGLQQAGSHLDRLLDDVVEAALLEGSKTIDEVWMRRLRSYLSERSERHPLARDAGDLDKPFTVATVEDQKLATLVETKHIAEIVRLLRIRLDLGALKKILRNVKPLHSVIRTHAR